MTGIFMTATGTAIGKTTLIQALLRYDHLVQKKLSASKPIITGWPSAEPEIQQTDTALLLQAQQQSADFDNIQAISPWRFLAGLTPAMAAEQENQTLPLAAVVAYCQQQIQKAQQRRQIHLIEGVGGVMAPLTYQETVLDWMEKLGCPCIVVAGSYLGTLSHTLTAIAALQAKQIPILALVVNETAQDQVPLIETCRCLRSFLPDLKVIALPYQFQLQPQHPGIVDLYLSLFSYVTRDKMLKSLRDKCNA